MQKWYQIFPKNTGLSAYIWVIFCILPFYFIFKSSSLINFVVGIGMLVLFFASYRLSFVTRNKLVYLWVSINIVINVVMTLLLGYVYLSLFLAFFIGNIASKAGFITLYVVHLVTTIVAITFGFISNLDLFLNQLPFIIICIVGVILLPFNMHNRLKREKLEGQLEDANERISQLMIIEERQRIARDLHDTLGQKLSLIGLKSDLAGKLVLANPDSAKTEIEDIRQTARTALKEVREMVSDMRRVKISEEVIHVRQILNAASMEFSLEGDPSIINAPLLVENVVSMCLKEAVTNIVKHSKATGCEVSIQQTPDEILLIVKDNGTGFSQDKKLIKGHGLEGMRERLEFVNGSMEIESHKGTTLKVRVPNVLNNPDR